jgi:copper homeostasis protein
VNYVLEVIVCSPEDALQAERGGATRLEIIDDLARGGFTPSLERIEKILNVVRLPARVILRESESYEIAGTDELGRLCARAEAMARFPLDGLVLGFTHQAGVDLHSTRAILGCAPGLRATFHHAFEAIPSPLQAISDLKSVSQIDRILTHGGEGKWQERVHRFDLYRERGLPQIEILAGGGLNLQNITLVRQRTQVREFHLGRAVRPERDPFGNVVEAKVREFATLLEHMDVNPSCCHRLA